MKQQQPQSKANYEEIKEWLEALPPHTVLVAQCASLCSLFISGSLISATITDLVNELSDRHKGMIDIDTTLEHAREALRYGTISGVFEKDGDNYNPTQIGWIMGQDWERKMRLGWNA